MNAPQLPQSGLCRYLLAGEGTASTARWGWLRDGRVFRLEGRKVLSVLRNPGPLGLRTLEHACAGSPEFTMDGSACYGGRDGRLTAPIGPGQEVWAAGVTYESSKLARMAESPAAADHYARVYGADRPELFLKATPHRVADPGAPVAVRADSRWTVPEPELALLIAANGQILGYAIGNDMSARDIEGENPLYLPQAKIYAGCCSLGPAIVPTDVLNPLACDVTMRILRRDTLVFEGAASTRSMRRTPEDLRDWLFRDNTFPSGVILLTGTGIVPPDDVALAAGDEVRITIRELGELRNTVHNGEWAGAVQ